MYCFPYPIPDDLFTLDPSSSQVTLTSIPDTELIQPPPIPTALERVGPDRYKSFILYNDMSKDDFLHLWLQTEQGSKQGSSRVNADDGENAKTLHWDGTGNTSDIWTHFKQMAHCTAGLPKVMCERCGKVLEHPNWSSNGTHSLRSLRRLILVIILFPSQRNDGSNKSLRLLLFSGFLFKLSNILSYNCYFTSPNPLPFLLSFHQPKRYSAEFVILLRSRMKLSLRVFRRMQSFRLHWTVGHLLLSSIHGYHGLLH